jgi:hypothetical protein
LGVPVLLKFQNDLLEGQHAHRRRRQTAGRGLCGRTRLARPFL